MPYTKLLNQLIERSGKTVKEIAESCTADGQKVTAAYISVLRNPDNKRIPSNELSRALAKACNAENMDILVLEAYLDKAPQEFSAVLDIFKNIMVVSTIGVLQNSVPEQDIAAFGQYINNMPMAEMISELSKQKTPNLTKEIGAFNFNQQGTAGMLDFSGELRQANGMLVKDNSMFPTLPQGSKAILEMKELAEYKDGDILCFIVKGEQDHAFRKAAFLNEDHMEIAMFAMNPDFDTKKYKTQEIVVLGRVKQVITNIQ